jgi:hypothetical protein
VLDLGTRLQLFVGPTIPIPAPFPVIEALTDVQVTNTDKGFDGFKLVFTLGKDTPLDYGLVMSGLLDPPGRAVVVVYMTGLPEVLIDGIIERHEVVASNEPGKSQLHVLGHDVSVKLSWEERNATYPNQPDSLIVTQILAKYVSLGLVPRVTPTTDVPIQIDRVPTQQSDDLAFIRQLALRNGFVFYVEPGPAPGFSTAYWGVDNRLGVPQPALVMNAGPDTNVDGSITFGFDALAPVEPQVTIIEPITKTPIPIPMPTGLRPPLARRPATPLRRRLSRAAANRNPAQGALAGLAAGMQGADAVTASGTIDAVRYGRVLRARRLVGVRGVGQTYGGHYYVSQVTHTIRRGSYKQGFTLKREGQGALLPVVLP